MSDRLDRIEALLEGHGMAMADIRARQEVMQQQQNRMQEQQERMQEQQQRMQEQQDRTQNQIDSIAALVSDTRQAALYLLETANNHENRLVKLEAPQSDAPPN
jgi:DNA-binding transcriptional MerR regulator